MPRGGDLDERLTRSAPGCGAWNCAITIRTCRCSIASRRLRSPAGCAACVSGASASTGRSPPARIRSQRSSCSPAAPTSCARRNAPAQIAGALRRAVERGGSAVGPERQRSDLATACAPSAAHRVDRSRRGWRRDPAVGDPRRRDGQHAAHATAPRRCSGPSTVNELEDALEAAIDRAGRAEDMDVLDDRDRARLPSRSSCC